MTTSDINLDVPDSGAVFAFGKNVPPKFYIRNDTVVAAACGEGHAVVVTSSGRVFGFGQNDYGQLGLGHRNAQAKPSCVKKLREAGLHALRVACGPTHTLVMIEGGRCFGFGNNSDGQLTGEATDLPEPVELLYLDGKDIKDIAAGRSFNLMLSKQGDLYAWGSNAEGCLGQGAGLEESRDALVLVELPERVVAMAAGAYHAACVLANGQVYAWGESEGGKLGLPGSEEKEYFYTPQRVPLPDGQAARSVACGLQHTLVLTETGRLLSCGTGDSGQLGLGADRLYAPLMTPVEAVEDVEMTSVSAGERHSACVSGRSGHLYAFGDALHGKLGPTSRRGQSNQYRPFRTEALARLRIQRAICGNLLTLVLAAPRSPDDPELAAAEVDDTAAADFADDPLDPMSAMSPRPLSRTLAGKSGPGVEPDGSLASTLLVRRSTRSRMKFRESAARQSFGPTMTDSVDGGGLFANGGTANFELLRPRQRPKVDNAAAEEEIVQAKSQAAVECQPGVRVVSAPLAAADTDGGSPRVAEETADTAAAAAAATADDGPIPQHVMAVTQFDNLLQPPGDLSPDTDEEAAAQPEQVQEAEKPLPKKRSEAKPKKAVSEEADATYAEPRAKPKKKGSGRRSRPSLPPPPPPPPPPPQEQQAQQPPPSKPPSKPKQSSAAGKPAEPAVPVEAPAVAETQQQQQAAPEPIEGLPTPPPPPPPNSGMTKGVGCGRGRRQPPPADAAAPEAAGPAAAAETAEAAGKPQENGGAQEASGGSSGAVSGVGCGGRRRKPAASSAPTDKPESTTEATAATSDGGAPAVQNGGEAVPADGAAAPDGAKTEGGSRSCSIL
ncbi:hypothetical protein BOX15_Mlig000225g1 [Macrostomum lignano]|uniref:RCC1-like domain-containing protein n=2 Tax=Macrostomum lignano TaxID=282301 RepID=A0A267GZ42_9PLAT|nr:hypothetical protein BOX15_Mlig000225g1 [Macrostomum lignano]